MPVRAPRFIARHLSYEAKVAARKLVVGVDGRVCALPDFIIIGAQKSGTSSLFRYLSQHPQVRSGKGKEIHFFDTDYEKGELWYRSHFPPLPVMFYQRLKTGKAAITGEASPYYLFHPHAARRIAEVVPDVKLITLLRNPADRALSHYQHFARENRDPLTFEEAIVREDERLQGEREKMLVDGHYNSQAYRTYSYKHRGLYAKQIRTYLKYFDREQMIFLKSERFFKDTNRVLQKVHRFLGLEPHTLEKTPSKNTGEYSKKDHQRVLKQLDEYFEGPNQELYDLLERNFGWGERCNISHTTRQKILRDWRASGYIAKTRLSFRSDSA